MTITWPYVTSLLYLPIVTVHNIWQLALYIKNFQKRDASQHSLHRLLELCAITFHCIILYNPYLDILINEISVILINYNKSTLTFTI